MSNMLREKIAAIVEDVSMSGGEDYWTTQEFHEEVADALLALPEIAQALAMRENVIRAMQKKGEQAMTTIGANMEIALRSASPPA